jgi:putative phosphoribosyl transferase
MPLPYKDRSEAGHVLAEALKPYGGRPDLLVLALPRGGIPVAYEVARALAAPLDLMLVRKLGVPGHEELAMGAIATGGTRILNTEVIRALAITEADIERATEKEQAEIQRRELLYRGGRPLPEMAARCIILIDDGLATGATMRAAIAALRPHRPAAIVVAVPVAPPETVEALRAVADDVVCPATPEPFISISQWYEDFAQLSDEEVRDLLRRAWQHLPQASEGP